MMTIRVWFDLFISIVEGLDDLAYQERVWIKAEDPGIVASLPETMAMLLDDIDAPGFLDKYGVKAGFTQQQVEETKNVILDMNDYDDRLTGDPSKILTDPEWLALVSRAKLIFNSIKNIAINDFAI
jgi:hypothetical protein